MLHLKRKLLPKYTYFCTTCEDVSLIKHSLGETIQNCPLCDSQNSLERRPSMVFIDKKNPQFGTNSKPGEVVVSTIEEIKKEVKEEQARLRERTIEDV